MTAKIVGLDLSIAHTGWAIADDEFGTIETGPKDDTETRLAYIRSEVVNLVRPGDLIVIEAMFTGGQASSAGPLWMLHGVIRHWLFTRDYPFALIAPATLKKYATGSGKATKPDMRVAWLNRYGADVKNDNACDALWLRSAGQAHYLASDLMPKANRDALKVVAWPEWPTTT